MPRHRSIVRIPRNQHTSTGINVCCLFVVLYIIVCILIKTNNIIIVGIFITLTIVCCGSCIYIIVTLHQDDNTLTEQQLSIYIPTIYIDSITESNNTNHSDSDSDHSLELHLRDIALMESNESTNTNEEQDQEKTIIAYPVSPTQVNNETICIATVIQEDDA